MTHVHFTRFFSVGFVLAACADPVHEEAVDALGGEAPGVPVGPLHRPGQPCVTCHGELGPAEPQFSLAGTVYRLARDPAPAVGALVEINDIDGRAYQAVTNEAGNFYIGQDEWTPHFPFRAKVTLGEVTKQMIAHVSVARSCADCHTSPPGQTSPGQIYLATNASDLPPGL